MESLQNALSHGFVIVAHLGYKIFQNAILKALFIIDEDHLRLAIDENVDLLGVAMIYAPQWLKSSQQIARQVGRAAAAKITKESSLKWLDEQCQSRHRRYYSIIVNLPKEQPISNPGQIDKKMSEATQTPTSVPTAPTKQEPPKKVYPPPGADEKGVEWWWGNVERLKSFVFDGIVQESTKHWCIEHLKWLAKEKEQGKSSIPELIDAAHQEAQQ